MGERPYQEVQAPDEATPCVKYCSRCKKVKDVAAFTRHAKSYDGFAYTCRECQSKYYEDNLEHYKRRSKQRYEQRREERLAASRAYYKERAIEIAMKRFAARAVANPKRKRKPYRSKWNPEGLPLSELILRLEAQIGEQL